MRNKNNHLSHDYYHLRPHATITNNYIRLFIFTLSGGVVLTLKNYTHTHTHLDTLQWMEMVQTNSSHKANCFYENIVKIFVSVILSGPFIILAIGGMVMFIIHHPHHQPQPGFHRLKPFVHHIKPCFGPICLYILDMPLYLVRRSYWSRLSGRGSQEDC